MTIETDTLRRAAAKIRERADLPYVKGDWEAFGRYIRKSSRSPHIVHPAHAEAICALYDNAEDEKVTNEAIAEHIAAADPTFMLAVADWLENSADLIDGLSAGVVPPGCFTVARAYLGEKPTMAT